jgi:predicted  nucleic acid-binding Zn-ribbon protein
LERVHTDLSAARSVREKLDAELQQLKLEKSELNQLLKALQQEVKRLKDESQQHENRAFHNARRVKQLEQVFLYLLHFTL